jgi:type I restriction enzyme S subunit
MILVTRSGTVGLITIVTPELEGALVDDHMIRLIPKQSTSGGLIFTYLRSPIGQKLLQSLAYGAVQKEIKAFQLENILVPQICPTALARISSNIANACRLRSEASVLHSEAVRESLQASRLQTVNQLELYERFRGRLLTVCLLPITEVCGRRPLSQELRLEAHYHNPIARQVIANIRSCPSRTFTVGELVHDVKMGGRFKRNYVEADFGLPFLSGKNIIQVRPTGLKYLSSTQTEALDDLLIKKGWILVTRSGTIGRTCFVWRNFEDYAASEDILRVIPNETSEVDPGYLYAFLSSQYGYEQIIRCRYGSVIDHIIPEQLKQVIVPLPEMDRQKEIGGKVRLAHDKRGESLRLEGEALEILMREITGDVAKES